VRTLVREKYGAIAESKTAGCCGDSCGCGGGATATATAGAEALGYTAAEIAAIPEGADLGLGCGAPVAHAGIREGDVILDLGSGAGMDVFVAARATGPTGRVIGVDMTPAMLDRARANAAKAGVSHAEFRLGEIEHLPVADASVDVVISNCVINLSPDKPAVFREAFRALRPGGRLAVSDIVVTAPLPEAVRRSAESWCGCVAGASLENEYLDAMRAAGFQDVQVVRRVPYGAAVDGPPPGDLERATLESMVSIQVRAIRPTA
jgi:SAM-dependent methyltransferase